MSKYYKDILGVIGIIAIVWALFLSGCTLTEEEVIVILDESVGEID